MYCICCRKNNVRPNDLSNNENKSEEEMIWWNEKRNGMNLTISNKETQLLLNLKNPTVLLEP